MALPSLTLNSKKTQMYKNGVKLRLNAVSYTHLDVYKRQGPKRTRIQAIVNELNGEKIDIITYSDDPAEFIARALAPAKVLSVKVSEGELKECSVIVPNDQLSLAIGNRGQNAKLAAKLTGYKIDIKPEMEISDKTSEPQPADE